MADKKKPVKNDKTAALKEMLKKREEMKEKGKSMPFKKKGK